MSTSLTDSVDSTVEMVDSIPVARRQPAHGGSNLPNCLHGALSKDEATRRWGLQGLKRAVQRRELAELWGVVVLADRIHDRLTRAAAALLRAGPDAVLSGATAVAMHGCSASRDEGIEVTIPYSRQVRSRPGLRVHQGTIRDSEVVELDGLRTHALDVALADLLCTGPRPLAVACMGQALRQAHDAQGRSSVASPGELGQSGAGQLYALVVERVARRVDRRGTKQAAAVLETQRGGWEV